MKVYLNELMVHRGETFTIDKIVVARDDAPFIVSSKLENPYITITVASSRYDQAGRYKHTWWLDADKGVQSNGDVVDLLRFYNTVPILRPTNDWLTAADDPKEAVWYIIKSDGEKEYKHWNGNQWLPYEFRIIKTFAQHETKQWIEQDYKYSITLVAGNKTSDYLSNLCKSMFEQEYNIDDWDIFLTSELTDFKLYELWTNINSSILEQYKWLTSINLNLTKGIDLTCPLINYSAVQIILEPTKLTVVSDLRGGV